jgi:hypothetical protein
MAKAKLKNHGSDWSAADVKKLRASAKAKQSARQTSAELGRTLGSVSQKALRLGIRFRSIKRTSRRA